MDVILFMSLTAVPLVLFAIGYEIWLYFSARRGEKGKETPQAAV